MSFSTLVKDELFKQEVRPANEEARVYSYLRLGSEIIIRAEGPAVRFRTKSIDLVKEILKLFRDQGLSATLIEKKNPKNDKRPIYLIESQASSLLLSLGLTFENGFPNPRLSARILRSASARIEFLRASFLFHGSINDPEGKGYHLEMVHAHEGDALFAQKVLAHYDIPARIITREKGTVLYVKQAEAISDFLKLIGANVTLFAFADSRIKRDMNNVVNRVTNCDIANEMKTQKAAQAELDAIDVIMKTAYMAVLSTRLQDAVHLRQAHVDASLSELASLSRETVGREISRSALAHCYRDLIHTAELIKEKGD